MLRLHVGSRDGLERKKEMMERRKEERKVFLIRGR